MNVLSCSINTLKKEGLYEISGVEVGQHFYWGGGFQVHAQVLITSWVVILILIRFRSSSGSQSTNHSNWRPKTSLNLSLNSFEM
uniref:Uncharacterized protein n=1 Tax=Brassica campestris TaxID=3711 RepID=A0A3P6DE11_BRACM|nr:unnamed protein product [Brassica rapa]